MFVLPIWKAFIAFTLALPVKLMLAPLNTAPLLPIVPALIDDAAAVPLTVSDVRVPTLVILG